MSNKPTGSLSSLSTLFEQFHSQMSSRLVGWQNITIAMVVKIIVLVLGAGGVANLWDAVTADVGVALLVILNAVSILKITNL
ncbi:hypothetical protein [Mucilaginibacter sp. 44-25]|jgi:Cd2+/Zn2+-exporting ATPase|uniref:hypothetical protein n=1 Tax=Mucilaginibacter sp. 44-25 TaxID=1895794 RepID=UPI0009668FC1|nr:hypothetical protein [Mucilaginibacter sp. 44-25]OJW13890.1 MAG: hypothetical protein BGO48_04000 [Mucilaginibacter sp. 44-25]